MVQEFGHYNTQLLYHKGFNLGIGCGKTAWNARKVGFVSILLHTVPFKHVHLNIRHPFHTHTTNVLRRLKTRTTNQSSTDQTQVHLRHATAGTHPSAHSMENACQNVWFIKPRSQPNRPEKTGKRCISVPVIPRSNKDGAIMCPHSDMNTKNHKQPWANIYGT